MSKKALFSGIFVLTLAVAASIYGLLVAEHVLHKQKPVPQKNVDFFMTNVVYTNMNNNGAMHDKLTTTKITHDLNEDAYLLQNPHFIVQDKNNNNWDISANNGKSTSKNAVIYLWDNVNIIQIDRALHKNKMTITTSKATIYPGKNLGETDQPITINENGNIVQAIGAKVDFNKATVKLLSKVAGKYKP